MHGFRNEIGKALVLYFKLTLVITFRPLTLTVFNMLSLGLSVSLAQFSD